MQEQGTIKQHEVIPVDNYDERDRDVCIEVNWNEHVKYNQKLRLSMRDEHGNKVSAIVDNNELRTILFMLSPEENLDEFFHNELSASEVSNKQVAVTLHRDAKRGETVMANTTQSRKRT